MIGLFFNILTQVLFLFVGNTQRLFTNLTQVNASPIVIVQQKEPELADSLVKHIYLSFDDGPLPGTSNCVDICTNQNVSATFFEVAFHESRSSYGKHLYQKILKNDRLFDIANHSFSHAFFGDYLDYYHHPDSALADFNKAKQILQPKNNMVRLPGNNAWNTATEKRASGLVRPLVHKLDSVGYNVIGWDMEWHFNKSGRPVNSPEYIASLADSLFFYNKTKTKNHLVILMHDVMFRAPADSVKLNSLITLLKQRPDFRFRKLSSYPNLKK